MQKIKLCDETRLSPRPDFSHMHVATTQRKRATSAVAEALPNGLEGTCAKCLDKIGGCPPSRLARYKHRRFFDLPVVNAPPAGTGNNKSGHGMGKTAPLSAARIPQRQVKALRKPAARASSSEQNQRFGFL